MGYATHALFREASGFVARLVSKVQYSVEISYYVLYIINACIRVFDTVHKRSVKQVDLICSTVMRS